MLVFLRKAPGDIPTPPRATTKLCSTPPVSQPRQDLEKNGGGSNGRHTSRLPPVANCVVNLTLTTQSRPRQRLRHGRCNVSPAQQTEACMCVKAGQICPATPGTGARLGHEASVKPGIFRLLGRETCRRARPGPQRNRTWRGARTARRYLRAVL